MHQVFTVLKSFNYGFNSDNLYLKFDFNEESLEQLSLKIAFLKPIETNVILSFKSDNKMLVVDGTGKNIDAASAIFDKSAELALSFSFLSFPEEYDKIKFAIAVNKNNSEIERCPYQTVIEIPKPIKN
jgi:hypothetical protein